MKYFPTLQTERLTLNELLAGDIPQITRFADNPNISAFTQNLPYPYQERDAVYWVNLAHEGFKKGTHYIFAIRQKSDPGFIGGISLSVEAKYLRAELGYWLAEPFWNQGLMSEAARAVTGFAFNSLDINKITCSYFEKNAASGKVMIRCGMKKEGELKDHIFKNGVFSTLIIYGITKAEYQRGSTTA